MVSAEEFYNFVNSQNHESLRQWAKNQVFFYVHNLRLAYVNESEIKRRVKYGLHSVEQFINLRKIHKETNDISQAIQGSGLNKDTAELWLSEERIPRFLKTLFHGSTTRYHLKLITVKEHPDVAHILTLYVMRRLTTHSPRAL